MAFSLELKVIPSSGVQKWVLDKSGALKCLLKSPPEDGKANRELIGLIARVLKTPQSSVVIIQGLTARKKVIRVSSEHTLENFLMGIGIESTQKPLW
jgi:uncharacterized protein (TIGR00251 family)